MQSKWIGFLVLCVAIPAGASSGREARMRKLVGMENRIQCAAQVNNEFIKLERSPSGLINIAIEDPHFDTWDVMIDTVSVEGRVKFRLAHFVPTKLVPELKKLVSETSPELQQELLHLMKARIVDVVVGFDKANLAIAELAQGDLRLSAVCAKNL